MAKAVGSMVMHMTVDDSRVTPTINTMKKELRDLNATWRANVEAAKAAGDSQEAARAKAEGLALSMAKQKEILDSMNAVMRNTGERTDANANAYDRMASSITRAEAQYRNLTNQEQAALVILDKQETGIDELNRSIKANEELTQSQIKSLKLQGDEYGANSLKVDSLKNKQKQLQEVQSKEEQILKNIVARSGEGSRAYVEQSAAVQSAKNKIVENNAELSKYNGRIESTSVKLKALKSSYNLIKDAQDSYITRLKAEGHQNEANVADLSKLKSAYASLSEQYKLQMTQLNSSSISSKGYKEAYVAANKTATEMARVASQSRNTQNEINKMNPYGVSKIGTALNSVSNAGDLMGKKVVGAYQSIRRNAATVALSVGIVGGTLLKGAQTAADIENSYIKTNNLLVTGGEKQKTVTEQVSRMQKDGAKYATDYGYSQKSIADGYEELVKRGYDGAQSIGSMKSLMQAARATGDDYSDVVRNTATALENFNMRSDDTNKMMENTKVVTNQMAYAADLTATQFSSLGKAMEYVGPSAYKSGVSLSETASAIGILSNNGLEADKAGTGLRMVLNRLTKETPNGTKALSDLGLSTKDFIDTSGKLKPINEIFGLLNSHMKNMKDVPKAQIFNALFGTTGQAAGSILASNAQQLGELNKKVAESADGQGYVATLAQKNMQTTKARLEQLQAILEKVSMSIGAAMLPAINKAAKALEGAFNSKNGQAALKNTSKSIGNITNAAVNLFILIAHHMTTIKLFGGALASIWATKKIGDYISATKSAIGYIEDLLKKVKLLQSAEAVGSFKIPKATTGAGLSTSAVREGVESGTLSRAVSGGAVGVASAGAASEGVASAGAASAGASGLAGLAAAAAPIAAIVAGVAAIGFAFYEAYKHVKFFRNGVNETASSINKNFIKPITKGFSYVSDSIVEAWKGYAKSFGKGFSSVFKDLPIVFKPFDDIKKTLKGVVDDVVKLFAPMGKKGGIIDSITDRLNDIGNWFGAHQKQINAVGTFIGKTIGYITVALEGMAVFVVKVFASMIVPAVKAFIDIFKVGYNFIALQVKGLIGIFKILGDVFTGHFKEAGKEFVNTFKSMFSSSIKLFKSFFSLIGNIVMVGVKAIDSIIEQIFGTKKNPIERFFTSAWKSTKKTFSALGSDISKIGKSIAKTIGFIWSGISKGTVKTFKNLVRDVSNIFSGVGKIISKIWKSISKGTVDTFNGIVKDIENIGKNIGKAFSSIFNGLAKTFSWFVKTETRGIKNIFNFFVEVWNNLNKTINKIASQLWNGVTKSLSSFVKWFKKTWSSLSDFFFDLWNDMWKSIRRIFNHLVNDLHHSLNWFKKLWRDTWKGISDFIGGIWNGIKESVTNTAKRLWHNIIGSVNKLKNRFIKIWSDIKRFFGDTWDNLKQLGETGINILKDKIGGVLGNIGQKFTDTWNGIKDGFKSMWDGLKQLGEDGINLVIKPINSGIDGVNGLIHDFGGPKSAIGNIPKVKFANGTGAIDRLTHAVLNDGNDSPETGNKETLIHPNGKMEVVQGRNTQRLLLPGTEVLNASETKMLMAMQGVRHFADGTGFFGGLWKGIKSAGSTVTDVAGNVWDGTKSVASSAWNGIKDATKKFTAMFKFITDAVAHPIKTLEGVFNPKNGGLTGAIGDITGGFIKKAKNQAKDWWSELWSMANDASEAGSSAGNKGDDYLFKNKGADAGTDPWGYYFKECVSFVASRLKNMGVSPSLFTGLGNGSDWVHAKVKHTNKPKPGDVAVYAAGSDYGNHVAMVSSVQGSKFSGEEYNFLPTAAHKYHTYTGRPISGATTFLDFGKSMASAVKDVASNSGLAKLIKKQTGGMMAWIQKYIAPLNDDDGEAGETALPKGSHKNWLKQAGATGDFSKWNYIINHESSWNPKAKNPGSDAYGIGQALPPSKMAKFGSDYMSNPITQLKWMKSYVNERYGGIDGAYDFWKAHHWYANGGLVTKHQIAEIGEGNKPEMIIPLDGLKSSRGYELLGKTMTAMAARDNLASQPTNANGLEKLEDKFDSVIQLLGKLVQGQANPAEIKAVVDKNDLYRKQAQDTNLRSYQSL